MSTIIIDYKAGNIRSIQNMIRKIGYQSQISDQADVIKQADKLILPGVGAFDHGVAQLKEMGLWEVIQDKGNSGTPLLGICLGAQLMGLKSEEGHLPGLGFFNMVNKSFDKSKFEAHQKIPHMGWSTIDVKKDSRLLNLEDDHSRFYFVHSYHFYTEETSLISATCQYGYEFPCAMEHENLFALQFHPEKSHKYGMNVLKKFADL